MVGSSKILTVSYGTFSCTLEGFDDSFDTMKAIAEYFRDLASDDRYFGAEPPTPDAEMLARIAEREVARRVEARTESSGIVLRTGQALPPMAQPAPQAQPAQEARPAAEPQPALAAQPAAESVDESTRHAEAAPEPAAQPAPRAAEAPRQVQSRTPAVAPVMPEPVDAAPVETETQEAVAEPETEWSTPAPQTARPRTAQDGDSVAAKLQRIRAVVGRQTGFADDEEEDIAPAARRPAAGMFDTAPQRAAAQSSRSTEDAAKAPAPVEQTEEVGTEAQPEATVAHPTRARVVRMRKADFDRALVRGEAHRMIEAEAASMPPVSHEQPDPAAAETGAAEPQAASSAAAPQTAQAETRSDGATPETDDAAAPEHVVPAQAEPAATAEPDSDPATQSAAPRTDAQLSEDAERALLEELAALEREMGFDQEGPASQEIAQADDTKRSEPAFDEVALDAPDETPAEPEQAEEDRAEDDQAEDAFGMPKEFVFNIDDRSDTERDVAHDRRHEDAAKAEGDTPEDEDTGSDRPLGAQSLGTDEADMSRLMSATAERMDDPESGRRREAISQLKAAVAATEAARQLGEVEQRQSAEEAFRDDLRQAVRPRRPVLPVQGTETADAAPQPRPARPRPAPLKLVASQRVDIADEPAQSRSVPVRPRRVAVAGTEPETESRPRTGSDGAPEATPAPRTVDSASAGAESFSDFATRMGAHDLGDLLEAAAAYTAFVEGAEDFSRPQLMDRVREVCPEPISREDGLRSFGTLLRQGMLKRVRSGRFAVASSSRFNPERRAG